MPEPTRFKYRAFLSYSHDDAAAGEKLQRAIETYRVPRELAGQAGAFGPIAKGFVRPIFRDRFELSAGPSLNAQVLRALEQSEALIVLCSPSAAKSTYVTEEIRQFKLLGRSHRIYPVIVDGEPGDAERECFPTSLRTQFGPDGLSTNEVVEPIAADLRTGGDGQDLAKLKLVAGVIGANLAELTQRELVEQRRRQRRTMALAAVMGVLAVAAVGFGLRTQALSKEVFRTNEKLTVSLAAETQAKTEAQTRYKESLTSTLRLVVLAATFRSLSENAPFQTMTLEEKMGNTEFGEFLRKGDPHQVWFQMTETLLNFQKTLPHELRSYEAQIAERKLPLQWVTHAERIMQSLIGGGSRPEYEAQLARITQEIERLGGERAKPKCNPDAESARREAEAFEETMIRQPQAQVAGPLPPCPH